MKKTFKKLKLFNLFLALTNLFINKMIRQSFLKFTHPLAYACFVLMLPSILIKTKRTLVLLQFELGTSYVHIRPRGRLLWERLCLYALRKPTGITRPIYIVPPVVTQLVHTTCIDVVHNLSVFHVGLIVTRVYHETA